MTEGELEPDDEEIEILGDLRLRVDRDGTIEATLDGMPVPVQSIDIDELSLDRLKRHPRTVRD